jgi:hypothetical protein
MPFCSCKPTTEEAGSRVYIKAKSMAGDGILIDIYVDSECVGKDYVFYPTSWLNIDTGKKEIL